MQMQIKFIESIATVVEAPEKTAMPGETVLRTPA